jgi:hypothetical protein
MKVVSKVNTKRLVKGASYEVIKLINNPTAQKNRWHRFRVTVKLNDGVSQSFSVLNFKMENGDELPKIDWECQNHKINQINYLDYRITKDNTKEGDYVVYQRNSHTSLVEGKKYKIEKLNIRVYNSTFGHTYEELDIKVEGASRFYKSYSFRKCTAEEIRDINLKLVFDENPDLLKVDKKKRKIELYSEEEKSKILAEVLFKSALDKTRNNLSVVDWAIKKIGSTYGLIPEDFSEIMDKKLQNIFDTM